MNDRTLDITKIMASESERQRMSQTRSVSTTRAPADFSSKCTRVFVRAIIESSRHNQARGRQEFLKSPHTVCQGQVAKVTTSECLMFDGE